MPNHPFWTPHDEAAYVCQEIERAKIQRTSAFRDGFYAGAVWAVGEGIDAVAKCFSDSADEWTDFPSELVRQFSDALRNSRDTASKILLDAVEKAKQESAKLGEVAKHE